MIKHRLIIASTIALSLVFIGCGSTPAAQDAPVTDENPVEEPIAEEKTDDQTSNNEQDAMKIEEQNKALWASIESARKDAIDAGAEEANKIAFTAAEAEYATEKLAMQNPSSKELTSALKDLNARYLALKEYAQAKSKKQRIDENNYASYKKDAYDEGVALINELAKPESNITFGDNWYKKAQTANAKMDAVLTAAFKSLAQAKRNEAFEAKKKADSVKSAVSRKEEYTSYVDNFRNGDQNYITKNPEGALENYEKARAGFEKLYTEIAEKRAKAQAAIDEAKKRVSQSESNAAEADVTKPLGDEPVEGIESEDAKLLEDDDFSSQASAEIEISETVEETEEAH
ncbi:MAG: hypothetical protein SOX88_08045 [Treponema sp.]|nr:hypothetical protein [Treponema sp.]